MENKEKSISINFTDRLTDVKNPSINDVLVIKITIISVGTNLIMSVIIA